jgi:hypothetical protein
MKEENPSNPKPGVAWPTVLLVWSACLSFGLVLGSLLGQYVVLP